MDAVAICDFTLASALGVGRDATRDALLDGRSGLRRDRFETVDLDTWIGAVDGVDAVRLPEPLAIWSCRNNRLAWLGLTADGFDASVARTVARVGATRVGVFIGTSTSGILETEQAYRRRDPQTGALPASFDYVHAHNTSSVAAFVRAALGLRGPACVVSAACASSAKVFAQAARAIEAGLIDAAVVGGVDSLCLTTLYGFASLELLSTQPCRPFDIDRDGLSIGEAAAFALLERPEASGDDAPCRLVGAGESSDGYHMSAPHPEGLGAQRAMRAALASAGLTPTHIDYVNLHGTGTPSNDAAEHRAMHALFDDALPRSSTKGATGHTLGAAGAVEAAIALLSLQSHVMPAGVGTHTLDPALPCGYVRTPTPHRLRRVLSNSFGFGGANCCLVFARSDA